MVVSPPPEEGGSEEQGGNIYQLLRVPFRSQSQSQTTHVPRIIAQRWRGRNRRAGPCAGPAGCEKFSWVLFIVSIIPGNEDSAIRTQLAVVLGMCEAEQNPGAAGGQACLSGSLESAAGNKCCDVRTRAIFTGHFLAIITP